MVNLNNLNAAHRSWLRIARIGTFAREVARGEDLPKHTLGKHIVNGVDYVNAWMALHFNTKSEKWHE